MRESAATEVLCRRIPEQPRHREKDLGSLEIGRIAPGAKADFLLLDYLPPLPLDSSNLFGHLLFGISNAPVFALMVEGRWVVRDGRLHHRR